MDRRRFLGLAGAGGLGALAGCGGGGGSDDSAGQALADHPAATDLAAQPRQGSLDGHVVLAFEDPSCERCAAFHEQTVPKIRSNLVDSGAGAYVLRTYPVIFPWGEPATQALEATFARDGAAFWSLLDHYYTTRSEFSTDNVLARTEAFLDSETDLAAAEIVADAEAEAYSDQVDADISAAEAAGLGRTTPIILLFRDGRYVTRASGSVSYEVIAQALGVGT